MDILLNGSFVSRHNAFVVKLLQDIYHKTQLFKRHFVLKLAVQLFAGSIKRIAWFIYLDDLAPML